ncbi:MAG: hypothetical protein AAGJ83_06090 [Planctomycetota bacterium]
MNDRLSELHFLPPDSQFALGSLPIADVGPTIKRRDGRRVDLPLPLFWYDPPWIDLPVAFASSLASAVGDLGVTTSGLMRDFAEGEEVPNFFCPNHVPPEEDDDGSVETYLPRMTPYRAERYGLLPEDFDNTAVVDVRLAAARNASGRFAYSPEQMLRWERAVGEETISGGGLVACSSFPADIASTKQGRVKLEQLRRLAPTAVIVVSIDAYDLETSLITALLTKPDAIILRMDQPEWEGIRLASVIRTAKAFLAAHSKRRRPLWIVPGAVSSRDVAKLIALGADAVAIDHWCNPLIASLSGVGGPSLGPVSLHEIPALAAEHLWPRIDEATGLISSILGRDDPTLGTYESDWAETSGATLLDC